MAGDIILFLLFTLNSCSKPLILQGLARGKYTFLDSKKISDKNPRLEIFRYYFKHFNATR